MRFLSFGIYLSFKFNILIYIYIYIDKNVLGFFESEKYKKVLSSVTRKASGKYRKWFRRAAQERPGEGKGGKGVNYFRFD